MTKPRGVSRYIYVVRGVQEVSVSLSLFCVFYSFKSISVKLPLCRQALTAGREGGNGGVGWEEGRRWREGGGAVM